MRFPSTRPVRLGIVLAVLALLGSACAGRTVGAGPNGDLLGDGELVVGGTAEENPEDSGVTEAEDPLSFDPSDGARGTISMARATWDSGRMQAEIYAQLLEELGYDVDRGTAIAPNEFYPELAAGTYDFWANGWPIVHNSFFDESTESGDRIGDLITYVGTQMPVGGLQGFLVDTATADEYGIDTLDDIAANPEIRALFDSDGDGLAEIAGCDEGWGCAGVIDTLIADNGWDGVIEQVKGSHGDLFAEQVARADAGQPALAYAWTPGPFITQLRPGDNAIWLGVENPSAGQRIETDLPPSQCRLEPCTMGFSPTDIVAVANTDFLAGEPAAAALLEQIKISVLDVSFQTVKMAAGEDSEQDVAGHASDWIASHRSDVDRWLAQAELAG
ncbi:MAG: glycine betaine/L-proline ABC transporter substrate-binding protein ProX [Acidimicrobiales bacterium]|nr:glycine betaine/L-proline ABC transporter substrate-binding protein ProX [Acidimicrobiales bacterium]